METGTVVSIGEYRSTSYRPDCDYVDGIVEEHNLGEQDHSFLQAAVGSYFFTRRKEWGIQAFIERRIQVSPTRFRVPDVCVVLCERPTEPFICIEILSPEDRHAKVRERLNDYLKFGVHYIWLLDPQTRTAQRFTSAGMLRVKELRTENPELVVPFAELFE